MITETNQNKINLTGSEWQLEEETRKLLEVRENTGNQVVTGFGNAKWGQTSAMLHCFRKNKFLAEMILILKVCSIP